MPQVAGRGRHAAALGVAGRVHLKVPHRKYQTPRVVDQRVTLTDYPGTLRQLLIRDLGHEEPTVLLTNDLKSSLPALITRYAQRMLIENGLADSVDFFHLDALSSAVALNVDFDVLLTLIGSGIYRLFARPLRGYEHVRARQLFRRFLDTTARVTVGDAEITVRLPRRAHNPILLDAGLIGPAVAIPWWQAAPCGSRSPDLRPRPRQAPRWRYRISRCENPG